MADKTFSNVKIKVAFTKASDHTTNIATGDNIADSLGKIAKWHDDFHSVVWDGNAATVSGHTVASNVPANAKFTDTTYSTMVGATASASGGSGLVPAPAAGDQNKFLTGAGTWVAQTSYSAAGTSLGLVKTGGDVTISSGVITVKDNSHNHTISNVTGLQTALDAKLGTSLKGAANGLAELDADGKVPSSQLPSYVDDVIEGYLSSGKFYKESAHTTEITGESGKIYVDLTSSKTYRWSGSTFVEISASLALGETSSTAYRGDHGKTAYEHSQKTGTGTVSNTNPHGLSKTDIGLGNVENKSSATIRSEITKANVTDALGYTPPKQDTTYTAATTSSDGLMSSADKTKLNGIAAGAEVNQNAFTNIVVGSTTVTADTKTDTVTLVAGSNVTITADEKNDKITITAKDTTYPAATTTTAGLMSASDKTKLNGIAEGANNYSLPVATTDTLGGVKNGNGVTIAEDGTISVATMTGATSSTAGASGLVPAPASGKQTSYLRGDGTWSVPTNTDTKVNVTLGTTSKAYLLGTTTTPTATATGVTAIADTGVYLDTTAGKLTATSFAGSGAGLTSLNASNISSGTLAAARLATSGVTAGSYGPSAASSPAHGGTFSVPYVTVDTYGRVTTAATQTITLPAGYTHPTTAGNKHIPAGGSSGQILRWSADGTAAWGADNNTWIALAGATASADGTAGYTPKPTKAGFTEYKTVNNQFLCGDGTWSSKPIIEEDTLILNCVGD